MSQKLTLAQAGLVFSLFVIAIGIPMFGHWCHSRDEKKRKEVKDRIAAKKLASKLVATMARVDKKERLRLAGKGLSF